MRFRLEIELGNDAMSTLAEVASALRGVATRIDGERRARVGTSEDPNFGVERRIRDDNGNTVGWWKFE